MTDHYHVRAEGPSPPMPERYRTANAALAHCPDGYRVEGCLATMARCRARDRAPELAASLAYLLGGTSAARDYAMRIAATGGPLAAEYHAAAFSLPEVSA